MPIRHLPAASAVASKPTQAKPKRGSVGFGCRAALGLGLSIAMLLPSAHAGTVTWIGVGNDGFLGSAVNFAGGAAPAAGDSILFTGANASTINNNLATNTPINGLTFDGTFTGATLATATSSTINLGGSVLDNSLNAQTISLPLALTGSQTLDVSSQFGALTVSGIVSETGAGFGLSKTGNGLLTLSGANTFTGPVTISGGALSIAADSTGAANQLGSGAAAVNLLIDGGALRSTGATQIATNRNILLGNAGAGTGGTIDATTTGTLLYNGVIANNGGTNSLTKTGVGVLSLGGVSTYTGSTIVNQGTLRLDFTQLVGTTTNILNPSSALVLNGLTTRLGGANATALGTTLNVVSKSAANSSQTFAGVTLNPSVSTISTTQTSAGNVLLNLGAITRNSGGAVNFALGGTLNAGVNAITTSTANDATGILGGWAAANGADYAANDGSGNVVAYAAYTDIAASGAAVPNTPGANVRINSGAAGNNTLGATLTDINTLLQNTAVVSTINLAAGETLRLGTKGGVLIGAAKAGVVIGNVAGQGTLTAGGADNTPGEINILKFSSGVNNAHVQINSVLADNGTGAVKLVASEYAGNNAPNSVVIMAAANSYSGGTLINGGRVAASSAGGFGTGPVTVLNGGQAYLALSAAGTFPNDFFIAGAGNDFSDTDSAIRFQGSATISGKITLLADATIALRNVSGNFITGQITGGYNLTITGAGATGGAITLSNPANNFAGNLTIDTERVIVGAANVLPNGTGASNVILSNNAASILDLNGNSETVNGLASLGAAPFVQNGVVSTVSTLTVGDGNATSLYAGTIRDNGGTGGTVALIKIGTGVEVLSGTNTFTGGITIKSGILFSQGASLGGTGGLTGAVTIGDSTGANTGAVTLRLTGVGRPFTGAINVASGNNSLRSLDVTGAEQTFSFAGPITLGSDFTINSYVNAQDTDNLTFTGGVTGSGNLTVNGGSGTITFSGANPLNQIGSIINSGTGTTTTVISAAIGGNVSAINQSSATSALTLSGTGNAYVGPTTVTLDTLNANTDGSLGTGNVSVLASAVKLTIGTGVINAIADTASLSLAGGGTAGLADLGFLQLIGSDTVGALNLGGVAQPTGTYGATGSGATTINDEYFAGTGVLTVVPEPGTVVSLAGGLACLLGFRRVRCRRTS